MCIRIQAAAYRGIGDKSPPQWGGDFFSWGGFKKCPGGKGITFGIFRKWKKNPPQQMFAIKDNQMVIICRKMAPFSK